jgi:putative photosynthetic complex assembly protein
VSHSHSGTPIPRAVLIGAAVMIAMTIALAGTSRLTGAGSMRMVGTSAVDSREVRFADQYDGSIAVTDATTGKLIVEVAQGTNGFLRSTLRGLVRERKRQGIGEMPPFRLVRWVDGRLTLEDPSTGRMIDLAAFGAINAEAFASILEARRASQ